MDEKRQVGFLIRKFSRKPEGVPKTVEEVMKTIKALLGYAGRTWRTTNIVVGIPTNRSYKDSDCGELARALDAAWLQLVTQIDEIGLRVRVEFVEDGQGELFVGLQNLGAALLIERGCDVMVTVAPSAFNAGYFDLDTANAMMEAHANGARIMAIAVPEDGIDEFVARGTAGGPIIGWDLKALDEVNGFDEAAAQAPAGSENPNAGCEEIHPIVRMVKKYGACYAPIAPRNVTAKPRVLEGEDLERHQKQIQTKTVRQLAHAVSLGVEADKFFDFFAGGVMEQYRLQSVE